MTVCPAGAVLCSKCGWFGSLAALVVHWMVAHGGIPAVKAAA